jgi:hypothetical protein
LFDLSCCFNLGHFVFVTFFIYLHLGPIKLQFFVLISLHYSKYPSGFLQILSDLFVFMTVSFLR